MICEDLWIRKFSKYLLWTISVLFQFAKTSTETSTATKAPQPVQPTQAKPTETKEYTEARLQVSTQSIGSLQGV